jgi:hypothetical protein
MNFDIEYLLDLPGMGVILESRGECVRHYAKRVRRYVRQLLLGHRKLSQQGACNSYSGLAG